MTMWAPELGRRPGPMYRAIADALADDAASGKLAAGTRLPTHRDLAAKLGVTVGTVSRGYAEAMRRGLVSGEVGRGTFVRGAPEAPLPVGSVPRDGSVVDLSVNHPPVSSGEEKMLRRTLSALATGRGLAELMGYQPWAGAPAHRAAGADWISRTGLEAKGDQVLVTVGSQHAMLSLCATLLRPGDLLLTEALTYPGMKTLASVLRLRLQGLPLDQHGIRPDAFAVACRAGARALYCVPTIQNPTASTMPEDRRREIAGLARAHGVAILEDDIHGHLPAKPPRPISAYAPDISYYFTSMSKTLAPGLRVGYLLAPPPAVEALAATVRATVWMAPPLMGEVAARWIRDGTADRVLEAKRAEAAARNDLARAALRGHDLRADRHGYHAWLVLPEPWRTDAFAAQVRRRGTAVNPAEDFVIGRAPAPHAVRLCLAAPATRAELERGVQAVAATLAEAPEPAAFVV